MREQVTVSVVIPCWRCANTIRRAISSVAAQTFPAVEVIVVDDASNDGTLEALHSIARDYLSGWIKIIRLAENSGPGPARNAGWDAACGDYIAFLDADDAWHPRKLELHIEWMVARPDVALSGHKSLLLKDGDPVPQFDGPLHAKRVSFGQMLISNRILTRTAILKRELFFRFEGRLVSDDFLLWAEIVASGAPCYTLDAPLAFVFRPEYDPGGYSGDLWAYELRELAAFARLRESGNLSFVTWLLCNVWSLCKYLRRRWIVDQRRKQQAITS